MIWIVNYYRNTSTEIAASHVKNFLKHLLIILNHHTLLKEKQVRANHAHFMTKELTKRIMEISKTKNKYLK